MYVITVKLCSRHNDHEAVCDCYVTTQSARLMKTDQRISEKNFIYLPQYIKLFLRSSQNSYYLGFLKVKFSDQSSYSLIHKSALGHYGPGPSNFENPNGVW